MFFIIARVANLYRVLCIAGTDVFTCDMSEDDIYEHIPVDLCGNFKKDNKRRGIIGIYHNLDKFPEVENTQYGILCTLPKQRYLCANSEGKVCILNPHEMMLKKSDFYNISKDSMKFYKLPCALNGFEFNHFAMPLLFYKCTANKISKFWDDEDDNVKVYEPATPVVNKSVDDRLEDFNKRRKQKVEEFMKARDGQCSIGF